MKEEVLILLIFAHLLGDFVFQLDKWVEGKNTKGIFSPYLWMHIGVHTILYVLCLIRYDEKGIFIGIGLGIVHLLIDLLKIQMSRYSTKAKGAVSDELLSLDSPEKFGETREEVKKLNPKRELLLFLADQLLHLLSIIGAWYILESQSIDWRIVGDFLQDPAMYIIVSAYIIVYYPMSLIIRMIVFEWSLHLENEGLPDAGKWIGRIERVLVLTFMLLGQFDAIGFLIAAKSILRYGDVKDEKNHKRAEYILVGTLISFTMVIFLSLIVTNVLDMISVIQNER